MHWTVSVVTMGLMLLLVPLASAETITMGETEVLDEYDGGNRDLLLAQRATITQSATLESLSFYVTEAWGQLRLGVYDASGPGGGPGLKIAETDAFTAEDGWNTRAVTTPVLLEAGTYWLAYAPSRNRLAFRKELTGSARYYPLTFGPMPTTFSTSPTAEAVHWSLYAILTPSDDTPAPPTVTLSANPSSVSPGGLSTLTWSSTNATDCAASNVGAEGSTWWGAKPTSGSDVRGPLDATATYSLSCTGPGGTASRSVTIAVTTSPLLTPTVVLTAIPSSIFAGQPTALAWVSTNATSCAASGAWSGSRALVGESTVSPTSTSSYTLTCTGIGGSAADSVTVTVSGSPPSPPTLSLTATPSTITAGQSTTLAWSATNATSCTATGGWSGSHPPSGELVVATAATATYTLTCTGAGGSTAKSVTVTVNGGPGRLTLTWDDNADGTAIVKVERKTGSAGAYAQIAATGAGATEYVDTTPVRGTMYCYRVRASNANGDSDYSNEACRTP